MKRFAMITWIKNDPAKEIGKLKMPVMIIQGTTDKRSGRGWSENMATCNNPVQPLKAGLTEGIIQFIKTRNNPVHVFKSSPDFYSLLYSLLLKNQYLC